MANALIVHKEHPPQSQNMHRAAQYVRMSTDYQKYSTENQAAVIAAYAQVHGLTIIETYRDEGESGLKIRNRTGLTQLIKDVQSGMQTSAISWFLMLAAGDVFRISMKARITSSSVNRRESELRIAPKTSTTTEA